jgi:CHAP domain
MVGSPTRLAAAAALSLSLSACASLSDLITGGSEEPAQSAQVITPAKPVECVAFARAHSGIDIHGDAVTWWQQAAGRYRRDSDPSIGSVMVLRDYAGPKHGHLAIVRAEESSREIRVDHANWLNDGAVYLNDPVADVSPGNDWSAVRVWNPRAGAWGARTYLVQGFIGPDRDGTSDRVAGNY